MIAASSFGVLTSQERPYAYRSPGSSTPYARFSVALAFDASQIESPQLARLILEKICRRIIIGQAGSHDS
jgi:hypothetical protein